MRVACVVIAVLLSACVHDGLVDCGNGIACPVGTACASVKLDGTDHSICVQPEAIVACAGLEDGAECQLSDLGGTCHGGACLPAECGNGLLDGGEACDDGNSRTGDGCSADCRSSETCGNGIIDPLTILGSITLPNEQCDDGNLLSHDGCSSRCQTEALLWERLTMSLPAAHHSHGLAYDSARDRIVMFGGAATGNLGVPLPRSDTWEFDGVGWVQVPTSITPPARFGHVLAYDPVRRRTVLFGGTSSGTLFTDTWEWDGTSWIRRTPAMSPSARRNAAAAYDPVRKRLVVFGGDGATGKLDDTWEWDGSAWVEKTLALEPPARTFAGMAFDPLRGVSVLAGGLSSTSTALDDTWEYDGTAWRPRLARLPIAGQVNGMAYDGTAIVAFGNLPTTTTATNTMRYTGQVWTRPLAVGAVEPGRRINAIMVADPRRGRALLVGGFYSDPLCPGGCPASLGDVWAWDRTAWTRPTVAAPTSRTDHANAFDPLRGCLVVFGGGPQSTTPTTPAETWELCGDHWVARTGAQPPARVAGAMAYDPDARTMVLFGGRNASGTPLADTWVWNGTSWSLAATTGPFLRGDAAMVFDPVTRKIILFGGLGAGNTHFDDTWLWNGTSWTEVTLATKPRSRRRHALTVDPIRERVVLFGGDDDVGTFSDQWEWTGTAWTPVAAVTLPPARAGYATAWSAPRQRAVLFGGVAQFSLFDDIWESSGDEWSQQFASGGPAPRFGHALASRHDGVVLFGGHNGSVAMNDVWRLRWDDREANELCTIVADTDGDGLAGCADPDCWAVCSPLCVPGQSCPASTPRCGDSICNADLETCRMCPGDCGACTSACGDSVCDAPETIASCPGDCP